MNMDENGRIDPLTKPEHPLNEAIVKALKTVYDPEIPVNIYELGLIYKVEPQEDGTVGIEMTLTSPNCPAAGSMPGEVEAKVAALEGVSGVILELVWEPPWTMERMTKAAKLELGML